LLLFCSHDFDCLKGLVLSFSRTKALTKPATFADG